MKKCFCDSCGSDGANNNFEYLIHLEDTSACGYIDGDGNPVSGRTVRVDLCNACYNKIVGAAVQVLKQNKKKNGISTKLF